MPTTLQPATPNFAAARPSGRGPGAWVGIPAALLLALALAGCSAGRELQVRADYVQSEAARIHDAAIVCAEREIAMAESNLDFGKYEMERGDYLRARDHLEIAHDNVDAAAAIVDARPECWPGYVADCEGDGLLDDVDQCRCEPEDFDNFEDEDGCPDPDNDGDGILDVDDSCPNDPEDFDLFEDEDGCPDPDNDGDGILDADDDCPNDPEDFDGDRDEDGCPEQYQYATLTPTTIEISQQIHFARDSARILSDSYPILDEVADILQRNPTIEISIEGHTSSEGSTSHNQRLSDDRAASVRAYLIEAGIAPSRMTSIGYGESRLLVDPDPHEDDRALNRRVEFHITAR